MAVHAGGTVQRSWVLSAFVLALVEAQVAPSPQQPVFRADADYVRVDAVVTDKNDKPITDLNRDDFTIVEGGRPQSIDAFEFISVPVGYRPPNSVTVSMQSPTVAKNALLENGRVFVLVVDDLHIVESQTVAVKKVMTEFLQAVAPDDQVGIVFTNHSNLDQNVTTDRATLLKAVDHVRDALGFGLDAFGRPNATADGPGGRNTAFDARRQFDASNVPTPDKKIMREYARESDAVLKNVAQALAGSDQVRRAIVYVSNGSILPTVPTGGDQVLTDHDDLLEAYGAARKADVPIYTIDPRGQPLPEDAVRGGIGAISSEAQRAIVATNIRQQVDRLSEIAINTGARALTGQSNLIRAVDEIVADNGSYYVLGYHPKPFEPDGKFHSITVRVTRPGARVRARAGYVAP